MAAREPADHQARHHRQDRQRPGHRRAEGHRERPHDGATAAKPAVLYLGAQHAREWITPEMIRRLMHYVLDGYERQPRDPPARRRERAVVRAGRQPRRLRLHLRARPAAVAQEPARQQRRRHDRRRRRRRPQPQLPDEVGLRQRGLLARTRRARPTAARRRPPSPRRRRSTRSSTRVGFEFFVNYHSAAELLLYGTGWQVATPTPDDVIYEAMAGDDASPAVPGYDPDISAELYTTNGDTDTHMTERYGTLGFTPEMSTCEAASDVDPDDEWEAADCGSGFEFPDDEELVQAEFEKNIPFALSVARVGRRPGRPGVGRRPRRAEDFRVDTFDVSYGDPQTVAVVAKRALRRVRMQLPDQRRPGRATVAAPEWGGGERYGDENDDYYAEFRGAVRGADAGRRGRGLVHRPTSAAAARRRAASASPTRSSSDTGADVLVIANEDYTGVNPTYPPARTRRSTPTRTSRRSRPPATRPTSGTSTPRACRTTSACSSHYDAVRLVPRRQPAHAGPRGRADRRRRSASLPDIAVAERQQYLTMAVRDYLNEGGKLIHAGETAQYEGLPGISDVGRRPLLRPQRRPDRRVRACDRRVAGFFEDCLILADDFRQYYLGALHADQHRRPDRRRRASPTRSTATRATLGGPVVDGDNPLDEAGVFQPTSDVLPVGAVPAVRQPRRRRSTPSRASPFAPVEGDALRGRAARRRLVHAPDADRRPDRRRRARSCSSSSRSTPSRATTT